MKCQECGSMNTPGAKTCRSCGRPLSAVARTRATEELGARVEKILDRMPEGGKVEPREVAHKIRMDYLTMQREPVPRTIQAICALMEHLRKPQIDIQSVMADAAALVQKQFSLREVGIGLKNQVDGTFRYEVLLGYRPEAEAATRRLKYTESEFWDDKKYKCTVISKLTRLYLAEDNPYTEDEKDSYNRPFMLDLKRSSLDTALEGDYIDVVIPGPGGEALGWIEMSGTRPGKLPDAMAIRWVEAIATLIGTAISCSEVRRMTTRDGVKKSAL